MIDAGCVYCQGSGGENTWAQSTGSSEGRRVHVRSAISCRRGAETTGRCLEAATFSVRVAVIAQQRDFPPLSIPWHEHYVVFAVPSHVRLALPFSQLGLLSAELGRSRKGDRFSTPLALRNGRAPSSHAARGGGLPVGNQLLATGNTYIPHEGIVALPNIRRHMAPRSQS